MVADGVLSFREHFQQVEDPRVVPRTTHSLHSILFIAVAATIAGADGPEDMAKFAEHCIRLFARVPGSDPYYGFRRIGDGDCFV
ncbi:MAG: transposase family protein [Pirellulaceae bacterium]